MAWKRIVFFFIFITSFVEASEFQLKQLASFDEPWGSSFINDKELILTEKEGKIKLININSKQIKEIDHNLNFKVHGQGGLLDIIYKDNFIWVSYSENRGNWKTSTSIAKAKLNKKMLLRD